MKGVIALAILGVIATVSGSSAIPLSDSSAIPSSGSSAIPSSDSSAIPSSDSSAIPSSATYSYNLSVGSIVTGDRLLYGNYYRVNPIAISVQYQDVVWIGNSTNRIIAIRAVEVGITQGARASILSGGLGGNNVTVRFTSERGLGFYYQLNIWGH